ncbi:MAG TPA: hypothetical protein VFT53_00675 [Candidatus Saccharimonadales bacterium]|nr:hypothetical protein [Candidatus Saccharimonadales bacterium]
MSEQQDALPKLGTVVSPTLLEEERQALEANFVVNPQSRDQVEQKIASLATVSSEELAVAQDFDGTASEDDGENGTWQSTGTELPEGIHRQLDAILRVVFSAHKDGNGSRKLTAAEHNLWARLLFPLYEGQPEALLVRAAGHIALRCGFLELNQECAARQIDHHIVSAGLENVITERLKSVVGLGRIAIFGHHLPIYEQTTESGIVVPTIGFYSGELINGETKHQYMNQVKQARQTAGRPIKKLIINGNEPTDAGMGAGVFDPKDTIAVCVAEAGTHGEISQAYQEKMFTGPHPYDLIIRNNDAGLIPLVWFIRQFIGTNLPK